MDNYLQSGYIADRVLSASPLELIRMLYEEASRSVNLAIEMLHANDIMARGAAITKAVSILDELRGSLNETADPEYAARLGGLYVYMRNRLMHAHAHKSEAALVEVSRLLQTLHEAWLGVISSVSEQQTDDEVPAADPILVSMSAYEMYSSSGGAGRSWTL